MASIRLILPPGLESRLKDVQSGQWPPLAPAVAISAGEQPGESQRASCTQSYLHHASISRRFMKKQITKRAQVSAPPSYDNDNLRFVGLAWGERCVLLSYDMHVGCDRKEPFWRRPNNKRQSIGDQQKGGSQSQGDRNKLSGARKGCLCASAGFIIATKLLLASHCRLRIPPSSGMLEAHPPGVPIVVLLLDPNLAEKPPSVSANVSPGPVHDHGFLLVCAPEACAELLQLWQSMLAAVATEQSYRQKQGSCRGQGSARQRKRARPANLIGAALAIALYLGTFASVHSRPWRAPFPAFQGKDQQGGEGEASRALAALDLAFNGASGSGPKDKMHWSRTWRSFLLPLVHDLTGLLYTIHNLPLLQQELSDKMQAAGLAPTRQPPVPPEQQPGASDEELAQVTAPSAAAGSEREAARAASAPASSAGQPAEAKPTEHPSIKSSSYTEASAGASSPSAGLSYLLRPVSRGDTVYESVAKAVLSTDQLSSRTPQESSSREMAPAQDSSYSGLDQVTVRCPAHTIDQDLLAVRKVPHQQRKGDTLTWRAMSPLHQKDKTKKTSGNQERGEFVCIINRNGRGAYMQNSVQHGCSSESFAQLFVLVTRCHELMAGYSTFTELYPCQMYKANYAELVMLSSRC
eukprot:scaffold7839_cov18-Tisochrysis_lutea.AAC.1